jgi:murein DD-endopeptidase MepM/ murein hydrolase activator NlpD
VADYSININVNDRDADRKLQSITRQANEAGKPVNIKINVPDLNQTINGFKKLGDAIEFVWRNGQYLPLIGSRIEAIQFGANAARASVEKLGQGLSAIGRYSQPINGITDSFNTAVKGADNLVTATARIGYTLFGVTQSVNILKGAYASFFNETIGREVQLRETILKTQTTLAGTNNVLQNGVKIDDPIKQLQALEGPIEDSIERIRTKSLEIAGVTSDAVIQTFSIVSQSIGQFGGTLKDAESLAAKFSGALGTLGLADPYYARQEVGSILRGTIDQNSILAKTLGISSADINRAKQEAGGLVSFLNDRLRVFEAGQKKAALGFNGVTSNLQELQEELARVFGASFLDPLLARITAFYEPLAKNFDQLKQTARAAGQLVSSTVFTTAAIATDTPLGNAYNAENINKAAKAVEDAFGKAIVYIQNKLAELAPLIQNLLSTAQRSLAVLVAALGQIAVTLAQIGIDRLDIMVRSFASLAKVVEVVVNAYALYLDAVNAILSSPLGRYLNDLTAQWAALEKIGILPFARLAFYSKGIIVVIQETIKVVQALGAAIATAAQNALNAVAAFISRAGTQASAVSNLIAQAFIVALRRVAAAVATLATQAQVFLVELAVGIQRSYPQFEFLTRAILGVASGFRGLGTAATNAERNINAFGVQAQKALGEIEVAANKAAMATRNVGATIGTAVTNGATAAARGIGSLAGGIIKSIAQLALWQLAITAVFDVLRRLSEWMEQRGNDQRYQLAVVKLTEGLNAQAIAAARAGRELDSATAAIYRNARASLEARNTKNLERYLKLQDEIINREKNLSALARGGKRDSSPQAVRRINQQLNPELFAELKQLQAERKKIEDILNAPERAKKRADDIALQAKENKQQIEELARFEKEARKSIDDQLFQNRMAAARKEIEIFRAAGEIRIQQVQQANEKLIRGTNTNARDSLNALNEYITSKKRGELDIEARRREAQIASAELDRSLMDARLNLEKQIVELKKKVNQYEIEVLDKRLRTEEDIARIRQGVTPPSAASNQPLVGGVLRGGAIVTQRNDRDAEQTGSDIVVPGGVGGAIQNPFSSMRVTGVGRQGSGSGTGGKGYGNYLTGTVTINKKDYEVLLGHLNKTNVKVGDIVPGGATLGTQGISGRATGPHVTTHVNALNGGDPGAVLRAIETAWTKGGAPIQSAQGTANPKLQLNLDTGGLEQSVNKLKQLDGQMRALVATTAALNTTDKWTKFIDSLYDPNGLQAANESLAKAKIGFQAIASLNGTAFNPEQVRIYNDAQFESYIQGEKYKAQLKEIGKITGITEEDRKKAAAAVTEANAKQLKQIQDRLALRLQERDILEQTAKLESLKADTKNVGLNAGRDLISGRADLAMRGTNDAYEKRMIQAQRDIALKRYELSEGGTKDISAMADEMQRFADATIRAAKDLAELDRAGSKLQVSQQISDWNYELMNTQGQIVSLGNSFKNEFSNALSSAVLTAAEGTATVQEYFIQMFGNIGKAFIQMATEMIAKAMVMQVLGILFPGSKSPLGGNAGMASGFGGSFDAGIAPLAGIPQFRFAEGGRPPLNTPSLVGEVGPELFIPDSAGTIIPADATSALMSGNRSALSALNFATESPELAGGITGTSNEKQRLIERAMTSNRTAISNTTNYSSRGGNIAFNENRDSLAAAHSAASDRQMMSNLSAPSSVNVNYSIDRINTVDYVTAEDFRRGISQATDLGARQGQQRTLEALRQRPGVRRSIGIGR